MAHEIGTVTRPMAVLAINTLTHSDILAAIRRHKENGGPPKNYEKPKGYWVLSPNGKERYSGRALFHFVFEAKGEELGRGGLGMESSLRRLWDRLGFETEEIRKKNAGTADCNEPRSLPA